MKKRFLLILSLTVFLGFSSVEASEIPQGSNLRLPPQHSKRDTRVAKGDTGVAKGYAGGATRDARSAQNVGAAGREDALSEELPAIYCGSMMPYDFSKCDSNVAWGDSLKPIYLSYTARHGARFLSSPKKIEEISNALEKAEAEDALTSDGERFLSMMREISSNTAGRWGLLSDVGIAEEEKLGADMAAMLPKLFRKGRMESKSTYVPRVIMTMYQFLHSLEIPNTRLQLYTTSGRQNDTLLRCFAADTAYAHYRNKGAWKPVYEKFLSKHVSANPARRLFRYGDKMDEQELRYLTMSMYGMLQANQAVGLPSATSEFMTADEFRGCWLASNLQHYLRNNINPLSGLAGEATIPLLKQIIADIDVAAGGDSDVKAHGYFGHAETLLPLLSLMRLPGCYVMTEDYANLHKEWQIQDITPLGANLVIVLLRGESGEVYASVRLNGKNVAPISGKGDIVKWKELKDFWNLNINYYGKHN